MHSMFEGCLFVCLFVCACYLYIHMFVCFVCLCSMCLWVYSVCYLYIHIYIYVYIYIFPTNSIHIYVFMHTYVGRARRQLVERPRRRISALPLVGPFNWCDRRVVPVILAISTWLHKPGQVSNFTGREYIGNI